MRACRDPRAPTDRLRQHQGRRNPPPLLPLPEGGAAPHPLCRACRASAASPAASPAPSSAALPATASTGVCICPAVSPGRAECLTRRQSGGRGGGSAAAGSTSAAPAAISSLPRRAPSAAAGGGTRPGSRSGQRQRHGRAGAVQAGPHPHPGQHRLVHRMHPGRHRGKATKRLVRGLAQMVSSFTGEFASGTMPPRPGWDATVQAVEQGHRTAATQAVQRSSRVLRST